MTCTYEVVSVYVCPYCSHDNETVGPCARCGLAGNPSKTPWGIKDNRHTKYWHKYNWQAQQDFDNYQERANSRNHSAIMGAIRPKGKLKDARFLRAGRPATMDFRGGISNREKKPNKSNPLPVDRAIKEDNPQQDNLQEAPRNAKQDNLQEAPRNPKHRYQERKISQDLKPSTKAESNSYHYEAYQTLDL